VSAPALRVVTSDGEVVPYEGCPNCEVTERENEELTRKLKGALLEARSAREERYARLWGHENRPVIELLHRLHHAATEANAKTPTRKKHLDSKELEQSLATFKVLGFRQCVLAIVGISYDPSWGRPGRNGKKPCHNTLELALRDSTKAQQFADRAPLGYEPDAERIAKVGAVPVEWVRELLGEKPPPKEAT